ncbi:hypothetical protein MPSEU_000751600 [Mayamaea pseudoterrestris]|nr:hypothetical protein MPSEU_000751600 [Mayamaea pseudoterrestris]
MRFLSGSTILSLCLLSACPPTLLFAQESNCPFPSGRRTLVVNDVLTMREVVNPSTDTITVEIVYQGEAWVGWAVSPTGRMVGADSVIGLPDSGTVVQHDMADENINFVTPWETQTIIDSSITQEDGVTTMMFTMPLANEGQNEISATGPNTFLFAYGSDNELGFHQLSQAFTIDGALQQCDPATGTTPDYAESEAASSGANVVVKGWLMAATALLWGVAANVL